MSRVWLEAELKVGVAGNELGDRTRPWLTAGGPWGWGRGKGKSLDFIPGVPESHFWSLNQ